MTHLNDEEIQSHLLGADAEGDSRIAGHLGDCDRCRIRLREYELIAQVLELPTEDEVPAGFEAVVMSRLEAQNKALRRVDFLVGAIALIGLGLIALVYGLSASLRHVTSDYLLASWNNVFTVTSDALTASESIILLVFTVALFGFIGVVDRLVGRGLRPVRS